MTNGTTADSLDRSLPSLEVGHYMLLLVEAKRTRPTKTRQTYPSKCVATTPTGARLTKHQAQRSPDLFGRVAGQAMTEPEQAHQSMTEPEQTRHSAWPSAMDVVPRTPPSVRTYSTRQRSEQQQAPARPAA